MRLVEGILLSIHCGGKKKRLSLFYFFNYPELVIGDKNFLLKLQLSIHRQQHGIAQIFVIQIRGNIPIYFGKYSGISLYISEMFVYTSEKFLCISEIFLNMLPRFLNLRVKVFKCDSVVSKCATFHRMLRWALDICLVYNMQYS